MKRAVVGVDGSPASLEALAWAVAVAGGRGAEVVAVNAFEPPYAELRPATAERLERRRLENLEEWCASLAEGRPDRIEVVSGDPRERLPEVAEALDADLLVVAATGAAGHRPGFLHLGSVVEHLTHHADVPLAVIPEASPTTVSPTTVLAVDGSEGAAAAARWLAAFAGELSSIVVVTVSDEDGLAEQAEAGAWEPEIEERLLGESASWFRNRPGGFRPAVVEGMPPAEGILAAAERHDAQLLVVGMRGTGGFTGLRLGGAALEVSHHATVPLVLVPPRFTLVR